MISLFVFLFEVSLCVFGNSRCNLMCVLLSRRCLTRRERNGRREVRNVYIKRFSCIFVLVALYGGRGSPLIISFSLTVSFVLGSLFNVCFSFSGLLRSDSFTNLLAALAIYDVGIQMRVGSVHDMCSAHMNVAMRLSLAVILDTMPICQCITCDSVGLMVMDFASRCKT